MRGITKYIVLTALFFTGLVHPAFSTPLTGVNMDWLERRYSAKRKILKNPFKSPPIVVDKPISIRTVKPIKKINRNLHLQGIILSTQGSRAAIINNIIVRVGDYIEGLKVKSINRQSVELRYGKQKAVRLEIEKFGVIK